MNRREFEEKYLNKNVEVVFWDGEVKKGQTLWKNIILKYVIKEQILNTF